MPSLKINPGSYRYGFNGKENDPETGTQDYGLRIYNERIGKFLSVDPLTRDYPWYTPYQFAGNKPIWAVDLDGAEELPTNNGTNDDCTDDDSETQAPSNNSGLKKNTIMIGNVNSTWPQRREPTSPNHTTLAFPLNGGSQTYVNTKITSPYFNRISEPDFNLVYLRRIDIDGEVTRWQFGMNVQKLKTEIFDSPAGLLKKEAPSGFEALTNRNFNIFTRGKIGLDVNVGMSLGVTIGHLQREPGGGEIDGYKGWKYLGPSRSFITRIDFKVTENFALYQSINLHTFKSKNFNVDGITVPSSTETSLSLQWGIRYVFNDLKKKND